MVRGGRIIIVMRIISIIILSTNPIILMGLVLSLSVGIVIFISWVSSRWFGIIVVIIYIGGMLVIFSYFVSLRPNQPFYVLPILGLGVWSLVVLIFTRKPGIVSGVGAGSAVSVRRIFHIYSDLTILILLIVILFVAIVIVTKIVYRNWGALRGV